MMGTRMFRRYCEAGLASVLISMGATEALAQAAPTTASPAPPPGVNRPAVGDPVDAFLQRRTERQSRRSQALASQGPGSSLRELNGLLRGAGLTPPGVGRNAVERARLEGALEIEVAQLLSGLGYNPGDVRRSRTAGIDLA